MDHFAYRDGVLCAEDVPLPEIARAVGTPCYCYATATDLADWLVRALNMPFRDAHGVTGKLVRLAEGRGCGLDALPLEVMREVEPRIEESIFDVLSVERSVASRTSYGGTAPEQVRAAIARARERGR